MVTPKRPDRLEGTAVMPIGSSGCELMANDVRRAPSPAISRAFDILTVLAEHPQAAVGPSALSRRTGIPKSTVLNLCAALLEEQVLRRSDGGYQLHHRLAQMGAAYLKSVTETEEFYDLCRNELTDVEHTAQMGVLGEGLNVICLARHDGREPLNLGHATEMGRSVPAYATGMGKALLAALDLDALQGRLPGEDRLAAVTPRTISSVPALGDELEQTRRRGYSTEHGEIVTGLRCFGIAVRTPRRADRLIGVSFSFPERSSLSDVDKVAEELRKFALLFADRIGGELAL
jgi:DNA-binding IclR family transcriptional regulator